MISWLIVVLIVIALIVFFKTTGVRFGRTWTIVIGAVLVFFVLSFGYVLLQVGEVSTFEGFLFSIKAYMSWLSGVFDNAATIGGHVTNIDWKANVTQ